MDVNSSSFGGAEIVILAALAVVALNIIMRGGEGRTVRRMKLRNVDGKPCVEIEEVEEPISISSELAGILRSRLDLDPPSEN